MLSKSVKKKLTAHKLPKEESFGRQIYFLYRYLAVWNDEQWTRLGLHPMGPSHIHLLFTIGLDGVSNSEMARRAKVSKQAMSKLVQEMLKHELIVIDPNEHDSRCNIISLTDQGASMLMKIWEANKLLAAEFEARLGKAKAKRLLALMAELVESLDTETSPVASSQASQ
ncbi:MAG: MarR family winged helix-turn-helix transcriptional regulator [Bacteroidetes bacterium]|nr:MarR family winged helix-turn-helix transcriptional regulator [Bacteroidota bacterium]